MDGITPGRRLDARDYEWRRPYQYREVLLNEIPFDLDVYDWEMLTIMIQPMLDFLDSERIPYLMSGSGGNKSVHVQIFFHPTYYGIRYTWKAVRLALWNWILDNANIPKYMRGNGKRHDGNMADTNYPYDSSCANFNDTSQAKVMRDFGGSAKGKGTKTLITELPESREEIYVGPVVFPSIIELWNPEKVIENELEFKVLEPKDCGQCPIDIEWLYAHEDFDCGRMEPYQYPRLCRACKKMWS
jgi:hypothetical protein